MGKRVEEVNREIEKKRRGDEITFALIISLTLQHEY